MRGERLVELFIDTSIMLGQLGFCRTILIQMQSQRSFNVVRSCGKLGLKLFFLDVSEIQVQFLVALS